jgi:hypothetical protein
VPGIHHGDADAALLLRAALVHARGGRHTLRFEPLAQLENADHGRAGLLRKAGGVMDVVEMPVRDQDQVERPDVLVRRRTGGIALEPWIDEDPASAGRHDEKRAVAEPCDRQA